METDIADFLLNNNIHLVMVESGAGYQAGRRLTALSGGDYFRGEQWWTFSFFKPAHIRITELTTSPIAIDRRAVRLTLLSNLIQSNPLAISNPATISSICC